MKKILAYIAISIVIVVVIFVFLFKSKKSEIVKNPPAPEAIDICYQLSQIDCEALNDKIIVEKYIRDNIKTIAPEKAVLGGSWYVTLININPSMKTGTMTYEDGHIQAKASFNYVRNGEEVLISSVQSIK